MKQCIKFAYILDFAYLFFDKFPFLNYEIVKLYDKPCTEPHSDHCLSKFERSIVMNLKTIFHFVLLLETIGLS